MTIFDLHPGDRVKDSHIGWIGTVVATPLGADPKKAYVQWDGYKSIWFIDPYILEKAPYEG